LRTVQAHIHVDAGEIDLNTRRRKAAGCHLHLERLDQRHRARAHRQGDIAAGRQDNGAGFALQIADRIGLDSDINLGQQHG
jgi:hypothetical protein